MMAMKISLSLFSILALGCKAQDIDTNKVHFYLWTRELPHNSYQVVELSEESLANSYFNPEHPTIILSHGWNSDGLGFGGGFKDNYFAVGDFNIFSIDWGDLESWSNYPHAAAITKPVGEHSAQLVKLLGEHVGVFENIHLVGHSLGAHVVGFIAKEVKKMGLGKISRMTGLDPAFPFFELQGPEGRIDKSDAEFVQIVHTNSGFLWEGCLSFKEPLGHVDFYPGGGAHQPGCTDLCIIDCYNETIIDLLKGGCSHGRANDYMVESVLGFVGNDKFVGRYCLSWEDFQAGNCCSNPTAVMGEWVDSNIEEGSYFLNVNEEEPFAMDIEGVNC